MRPTARGRGAELYEPRFTFHGLRYVEVSGADVADDALMAAVLHSDAPFTGEFSCANQIVNQLQCNLEWSQRGNSRRPDRLPAAS